MLQALLLTFQARSLLVPSLTHVFARLLIAHPPIDIRTPFNVITCIQTRVKPVSLVSRQQLIFTLTC